MQHNPGFLTLVEDVLPRVQEISAEDTLNMLKNLENFLLVDVREDHEWEQGHIKDAQHLSRGIIERDIETRVPDKAAKIVLYCGGGYRSALSAENLQKMGYRNVYSMSGGWRDWNEKGFPRA